MLAWVDATFPDLHMCPMQPMSENILVLGKDTLKYLVVNGNHYFNSNCSEKNIYTYITYLMKRIINEIRQNINSW